MFEIRRDCQLLIFVKHPDDLKTNYKLSVQFLHFLQDLIFSSFQLWDFICFNFSSDLSQHGCSGIPLGNVFIVLTRYYAVTILIY